MFLPDPIAKSQAQGQHKTNNRTHYCRMNQRNGQLKDEEHEAKIREYDPSNKPQDTLQKEIWEGLIGLQVQAEII